MSYIFAPSLLSADFANLQKDIELINSSEADWFHIDVMDGQFVPNISFGFPVLEAVSRYAKKPLDVHLMIANPDRYIEQFVKSGANIISVHYEACTHLHRSIHEIKQLGAKASVALNPHTPVSHLEDIINDLDMVLIMSVNPGFAAQKFIENTYLKVEQLKNLILKNRLSAIIQVDGGVGLHNAGKLLDAGAGSLVAGSAVFGTENPLETIKGFKKISGLGRKV